MADKYWLILVVWGDRYSDRYINHLAKRTLKLSTACERVLLITDRERADLDSRVSQQSFPEGFRSPELFKGGYPAKLALFTCPGAPANMRCVYVDLDTIVLGDFGKVAAELKGPDDILMFGPALFGFNGVKRQLRRMSRRRRYAVGNSSIVAFTAAAGRRLADRYVELSADPSIRQQRHMKIDDAFISWFAADHLRPIPKTLAVMFRREFLSRVPGYSKIKGRFPWVRRRRQNLVAVTFNGVEYTPSALLKLSQGDPIPDRKGRTGYWSEKDMGGLQQKIASYCRDMVEGTDT